MSRIFLLFVAVASFHFTAAQDSVDTEGRRCPPGFKLASKNTCIKLTKVKATLTCPAGFEKIRGRCKKTTLTDAAPVCQAGFSFDLATKKCEKTIKTPAKCPNKFQNIDNKCQRVVQVKPSCKKGSVQSGGKCVQESRKTPTIDRSCRDGFKLDSDGKCRKSEDAIAFCKEGELVDGDKCKSVQFAPFTCADGFTLVNNRCEKRAPFFCAKGKLAENKCLIQTESPAICPRPFVLVNGKCQQAISKDPKITCPSGGNFDFKSKKCIEIRDTVKTCRAGFSGPDSNGKCTKRSIDIQSAVCKEGHDDGNRCRIESQPHETFSCKAPLKLEGNRCVGDKIVPAIKKCAGWGNYWIKKDSSTVCMHNDVDPKVCPRNYSKLSNGWCRCNSRDRRWCPHGHETMPRCASGFYELPKAEQQRIGRGLACIKPEHPVKLTLSCPSKAFQLRGDKCVQHRGINIPAVKSLTCRPEQGQLVNGRTCIRFVDKVCRDSSYRLIGGKCIKTTIVVENAQVSCASGFHARDGKCVRITSPKVECDSGLQFDSVAFLCRGLEFTTVICPAGTKLQGKICIGTQIVDAQCPSGFTSTGKDCLQTQAAKCPSGFALRDGKCAKDVFTNAEFRCASGQATLQGKLCITTENATVTKTCPADYVRDGEFCLKVTVTPAVCPELFTLVGQFCDRTIMADFVCQKGGFTLVGDMCEKKITREPKLQCAQGSKFQKRTKKCLSVEFEDGSLSCDDAGEGFELKKQTCVKREVIDTNHGKH